MTDHRKRVEIYLPKTPTIYLNLNRISSMWPSLICDLLYTGLVTRSEYVATKPKEVQELKEYLKITTRYTPSIHLHLSRQGANFVERVVANKIENSSPEELGELLADAIELIGLDNIIAYAPDAFSSDAVAENIEASSLEHPIGQQSDQRTMIESGSLGQTIQLDSDPAAELDVRDESKSEQVSTSAAPFETMGSVTDSPHSHETDTTASSHPDARLPEDADDFMSKFDNHATDRSVAASPVDGGTHENQVSTNGDVPDELVANYPVESNNGILASGTIENNEVSTDETAPVIPAASEPIQTGHAESTSHRAVAPENSDTELADKRSRYAKYAKF
jgi:hypothetical protein